MFVESYRNENSESIMAGGDSAQIPYPKISNEDWRVWTTFLPVRSHNLDRIAASNFSTTSLHEGIPGQVALEVQRASRHFDKVEVWRKERIEKDPIAVGVLGGERYLIARWGLEKLLPFEAIKKSLPLILAWKCATSPLGLAVEFGGVFFLAWNLLLA